MLDAGIFSHTPWLCLSACCAELCFAVCGCSNSSVVLMKLGLGWCT
jgi:hypothetical protein